MGHPSKGSHSNGVAGGSLRRTNTHNLSNGSSRLRSPPSFPSRLPSEDCVPDPEPPGALNARGGFENRGIDEEAEPTSLAISAVTGSTLPPIQGRHKEFAVQLNHQKLVSSKS